jgi:hypothetical protein
LHTMLTLSDGPYYHQFRTSRLHVTPRDILEGERRNASCVGITEHHASFLLGLNCVSLAAAKINNLGIHIPAAVCSVLRISLPRHLDTFTVVPVCTYSYLSVRAMCR